MTAFTIADELLAGRDFPARTIITGGQLVRLDHTRCVAYLREVQAFWLDVAAALVDQAEAGCPEPLADAREAFSKAQIMAPGS